LYLCGVPDKSIEWLGSSRTDLRALPEDARRALGFDLRRVQGGRLPRDWKPMPTVGAGVVEIRVRDATGAYRLMYVAKLADAIFVLHVFEKKSQKTAKLDLALAENRYATLRRRLQEK
jgi:phage-related protein